MGTVMTAHTRINSLDECCGSARWSVRAQAPGDQELKATKDPPRWKIISPSRGSSEGPEREVWTLFELTSVTSVPRMDIGSLSDPYIHAVIRRGRFARCMHRTFPYALNGYNIVWELRRYLQAPIFISEGAHPSDLLELHVYEHDSACSKAIFGKDLIGFAKVAVAEIEAAGAGEIITVPLNLSAKAQTVKLNEKNERKRRELSTISVRLWPSSVHEEWPKVKWIFLIRHGESAWNVAEKDPLRELGTLVAKMDHFLSLKGCKQASDLASKIEVMRGMGSFASTKTSDDAELHNNFLEAEAIIVSPLARALQTALLATRTHPTAQVEGLNLRSELREVKSYFGRDTQSKSRHHQIVERCFDDFKKKGLDIEALERIKVDTGNTRHEWWDAGMEHADALQTRTREILTQVKLNDSNKVIIVTHSFLVQQLLKKHWFEPEPSELAARLIKTKLPNCGVLACRANFNLDVDACIDKVSLLFDTKLPDQGPGDNSFLAMSSGSRVDLQPISCRSSPSGTSELQLGVMSSRTGGDLGGSSQHELLRPPR